MHHFPVSKLLVLLTLMLSLILVSLSGSLRAETVQAPTDTSASGELVFWNSIKKSENAGDFDVYLKTFPDGMFAEIAKSRYLELGGTAAVVSPKVEQPVVIEPEVKEVLVDEPEPAKAVAKAKQKKQTSSVFVKKKKAKVVLAYSKDRTKKKAKWASTKSKRKYVKKSNRPVVVKAKYAKPKSKVVKKKIYVPTNEPASGTGGGGGGGSGGGGGGWGGG